MIKTTLSPRGIFFDTGPIISLVISRMAFILPELKKQYGGEFYITPAVYFELVERPLTMNRYKFEALQVLRLIREGTFKVYEKVPKQSVSRLITLANSSFFSGTKSLDVLQEGEVEATACALQENADALVVDERALRLFIEDSDGLRALLTSRFQRELTVNKENINAFSAMLKGMTILRSVELVGVGYRKGLFDMYVPDQKKGREVLIDALLWTVKTNGCAVNETEIESMKEYLLAK